MAFPEHLFQFVVQDFRAHLQEQVRALLAPLHLLFLHHPLADHLVYRRFHERRRDPLVIPVPFAVVRDESTVGLDI